MGISDVQISRDHICFSSLAFHRVYLFHDEVLILIFAGAGES